MAKDKRELSPAELLLHKWAEEKNSGQPIVPDHDPDFSASFPALWVLLTWTTVGKLRKQPGSLSLRAEGTGWRATYLDPTAKRRCSALGATLMDTLRALDAAVVSPTTVWDSMGNRNRGWREDKK